jgi:ABC-type lipoprotein release transport system permease subunit
MWRVILSGMLAHKLRLALTALAIVLGVTFITGTLVLTDTLHNTFTNLFGNVYQHVDFQVRGKAVFTESNGGGAARPRISESLLHTVRSVPGVAEAQGSVSGYAQFIAPDGKAVTTNGAPTIGTSLNPSPQMASLHIVEGREPRTMTEVEMDQGTAQKHDFKVGDKVRILLPGPTQTFTLTGIVRFGTANNLAGATIAAFTLPTAQSLFNAIGKLDAIDVLASAGADKATLQRNISAVLPPGVEVVTGQTVADENTNAINQALGFFSTALLVFAFIALFVGGFTIFNTFSIIVGQRTRELAMLRMVGASRSQVFRSVLAEAALVGLLASASRTGPRTDRRHRAGEALEWLRHHPSDRHPRVRTPHGSGRPGGRSRRDRHLRHQPCPQGRSHPPGGRHCRTERGRRRVVASASPVRVPYHRRWDRAVGLRVDHPGHRPDRARSGRHLRRRGHTGAIGGAAHGQHHRAPIGWGIGDFRPPRTGELDA